MFYTYAHSKPDGTIFYIGKGKEDRAWSKDDRNPYWKHTVAKYGYEVKILANWESDEEACEHEKFLIACFKDIGIRLVNLTDGGEGSAGYRWTDEQKAKFDMSGDKNGMFGKKHSEETRMKIAEKARCRKISDETRKKLSISGKGRKVSESTKEKLRIASSNRTHSQETKDKLSAIKTGRKLSDDHKARIAKGGTGRKNTPETIERMRQAALLRPKRKQGNETK